MKAAILFLLAGTIALAGCATSSTVATRKQERVAAYEALSAEDRTAVDQGVIRAGMSMDAVYIAMGNPSQITRGGDEAGETTTWIYHGGYMRERRYWGYRRMYHEYDPGTYVRARVTFVNGVVKRWQTFPEPPY